jgi:hypothetical protein
MFTDKSADFLPSKWSMNPPKESRTLLAQLHFVELSAGTTSNGKGVPER